MMKRLFISAILFAVLILEGCGSMAKQQNINEMALEYMEQKYGEKFEYVAPWGNSMTGTHEFLAKCESMPDKDILVEIEKFRHEDRVFLDNYIAVKYESESIDFFHTCAMNSFKEATVFYEVRKDGLSPELSSQATLAEFLADTRVPLIVMVAVKTSDFSSEDQALQIAERIAESGAHFILTIVVVEDSEYGSYNRTTLNKLIAHKNYIHCAQITHVSDTIETLWFGKE